MQDDNLYALATTFSASTPTVNTSSNVGDEADNVTVTQATTYTMFGAKKADLEALVTASLQGKYDDSKQAVMSTGLDSAQVAVPSPGAGPQLGIGMSMTATIGPKINTEQLKQQIVGMKSGAVRDAIKSNPGVTDVTVNYSPFWVTKAPKAEKITIQYNKTSNNNNSGQ